MSRVPIVQPGVLDAIHAHVNSAWARKVGGILIGRPSGDAVKVEGALPARQTLEYAQEIAFPPSVWEEAYAALDRYPGARIVGWYHSHPGTGVALTEYDRRLHAAMFSEPSNVALVVDPIAQTLAWFGWAIVPLSSDDLAATRASSGTAAGHRGWGRRRQAAVAGLVALGIAAGGAAGYGLSGWRGEQRSPGQESLGPAGQAQRTQIARLRQALEQARQDLAQDQGKLRRVQDALDAAKTSLQEARRKLRRLTQPPPAPRVVHYRVRPGDSLWDLARTYYGDPLQWTRILDANRPNIADPDRLEVGLLLEIPLGG